MSQPLAKQPTSKSGLIVLDPKTKTLSLSPNIPRKEALSTLRNTYATSDTGLAALLLGYQASLNQQGVESIENEALLNPNNSMAFVQAMAPQNPLEAMLVSQMLALHHHTMSVAAKLASNKNEELSKGYVCQLNQLATTFAKQTETFHKLRHGGKQTVQVLHQHVQADAGSQVMVAQKG